MPIRSNIGNVITNATQIASVGATTASGLIRGIRKDFQYAKDRADTALNNKKREEERLRLQQEKEELAKRDPNTYKKSFYSEEEAKAVGEAEAIKRKERALGKNEEEDIDEILTPKTEQGEHISEYVNNNLNFYKELSKMKENPFSYNTLKDFMKGGE